MANEQQWIAFRVAEQVYGLPIAAVRAPDAPVPGFPARADFARGGVAGPGFPARADFARGGVAEGGITAGASVAAAGVVEIVRAPGAAHAAEQQATSSESKRSLSSIDAQPSAQTTQHSALTPIPQAPEHIAGVMNLRGHIVPVVDLHKKLGIRDSGLGTRDSNPTGEVRIPNPASSVSTSPVSPKSRVLIVTVDARLIGLLVDEASEVLKIAASEIEATPKFFADDADSYVTGIAKHRGRLVVLLDAHKLLKSEEAQAGRDAGHDKPDRPLPVASCPSAS